MAVLGAGGRVIVDVLLQFAEWLRDVDEGYSAQRANVPRDPGTDPPPDVRVVCAVDDSEDALWAARNELPREKLRLGPVLVVRLADSLVSGFAPTDGAQPASVPVGIIYGAIGDRSNYEARNAFQALRVAQRVFAERFKNAVPAEFDRNGTKIKTPEGVTYIPLVENQDSVIATGIVFNVPCDDPWAQGSVT